MGTSNPRNDHHAAKSGHGVFMLADWRVRSPSFRQGTPDRGFWFPVIYLLSVPSSPRCPLKLRARQPRSPHPALLGRSLSCMHLVFQHFAGPSVRDPGHWPRSVPEIGSPSPANFVRPVREAVLTSVPPESVTQRQVSQNGLPVPSLK